MMHEGSVRKGGIGKKPITLPPESPVGQGYVFSTKKPIEVKCSKKLKPLQRLKEYEAMRLKQIRDNHEEEIKFGHLPEFNYSEDESHQHLGCVRFEFNFNQLFLKFNETKFDLDTAEKLYKWMSKIFCEAKE